jgi:hypothetical protein
VQLMGCRTDGVAVLEPRRRAVWLAALVAGLVLLVYSTYPISSRAAGGDVLAQRATHTRYCTRRSHPRGCVRVPKTAQRPKNVSEQGPNLAPKGSVDGGGLGSGPGVKPGAAVAWAKSQLGSRLWAYRCELFVEQAFGTSGQFRTAWAAAQRLGLRPSAVARAPAGALLFFAPDAANDDFGHVGVSLGGGKMVSALNTVQITNVSKSRYWSSLYRGWATAPSAWPGRIPPPPGTSQPLTGSAVQITAPAVGSVVGGTVELGAAASNVGGVAFYAYYTTVPSDEATAGWHFLGDATSSPTGWNLAWDTVAIPDQGDAVWGTVNVAAVALDKGGALTGTRDYRRISLDNSASLPPGSVAPQQPPPSPAGSTYPETTGGAANTWSDYMTADGVQGPYIPVNTTVQITCATAGFRVADGNTWWYKIASSPWNNAFYVSADAFYNNGRTTGSLAGTPFVDSAVPAC